MSNVADNVRIACAGRVVDGCGRLAAVDDEVRRLRALGATVDRLVIDDLATGWRTPVGEGHFRTGAAPAFAVAEACARIRDGRAEAVLIAGDDALRSGYTPERRRQLMRVYDDVSIPEAYTRLAFEYSERRGWNADTFRELRDALWRNHVRRGAQLGIVPPPAHRHALLTDLFRFVDCANPVVDFSGRLLLARADLVPDATIAIAGVGTAVLDRDGPQEASRIARYDHLRAAFDDAMADFGADRFARALHGGDALLELYTCFPVVPLAALLESGLAVDDEQLAALLDRVPVTVTGGMNLGRGPWANAALNGLVVMTDELIKRRAEVALVHANGGLGYRQGWVLLQRVGEPEVLDSGRIGKAVARRTHSTYPRPAGR